MSCAGVWQTTSMSNHNSQKHERTQRPHPPTYTHNGTNTSPLGCSPLSLTSRAHAAAQQLAHSAHHCRRTLRLPQVRSTAAGRTERRNTQQVAREEHSHAGCSSVAMAQCRLCRKLLLLLLLLTSLCDSTHTLSARALDLANPRTTPSHLCAGLLCGGCLLCCNRDNWPGAQHLLGPGNCAAAGNC